MTKKNMLIISLLCLCIFVHAQNTLVERYLNAANSSYSQQDYAKAFDYINYVFGQYTPETMPKNVEILAETIYYDYLVQIRDRQDTASFQKVKNKLAEYPSISSERVTRLVRTINALETQNALWGPAPAPVVTATVTETTSGTQTAVISPGYVSQDSVQYQVQLAKTKAELEALEKALEEAKALNEREKTERLTREQELLKAQQELYETALAENSIRDKSNRTFFILAGSVILVFVLIIFSIVLIVIKITARNNKKQQEQFEATLQLVSQMSRNPNERLSLGQFTDLYDQESVRSVGTGSVSAALPRPEMTDEEQRELKELALQCETLGEQIDRVTGRKNNSKNVAEMVFKLAHEMQCSSYDAMLYFCASMVYDAGFLSVDPQIFLKEKLTDEEKYIIRGHVKHGATELSFIPDKYKKVFLDAALMHHENMDGSGYPEGIKGTNIPLIARIIRVVESFISLISRRNYRGIFDKEAAINELKKSPGLYDQDVVNALDEIV